MFTGFPKLTSKLIETLISQGFLNYVQQRYPVHPDHAMPRSFLFSPFKEDYKAEHYFQRLNKLIHPVYYNMCSEDDKKKLFEFANTVNSKESYIKIIEHNYKLDDTTRYLIASYVKEYYPNHFDLMAKNNFRIVIGDNFGDVFYTIRIGQGILLPVQDASLNKYRNNVQRPQQVLRFAADI